MSKLFLSLFVTSLFLALVRADYTIDDSNYSILKFSENPAGPVWSPFGSDTGEVLGIRLPNGTMQTIDATQCYDGTYTYAACNASNNCAVQFSFTGSGITIYVLQAGSQGMSASLSIDSGSATTATLDAPPPPQYCIPRVSLFDIQNILSGTHTAVMRVLNWNGGFSGMMLDYIDVNQATVTPTISSSPPPSPSPSENTTPTQSSSLTPLPTSANPQTSSQRTSSTSSATTSSVPTSTVASVVPILSSQSSGVTMPPSSAQSGSSVTPTDSSISTPKSNIAVTVGSGIGGGVGLLALLGLIYFCFYRRGLRYDRALDERPRAFTDTDPASINPFGSSTVPSIIRPSGASRHYPSGGDSEAGSIPNLTILSSSSPMTNISHARVSSSGDISATSSVSISIDVVTAASITLYDQDHQLTQPGVRSALPVSSPDERPEPASGAWWRDQSASADATLLSARESVAGAALTDDQADFVDSLFNDNVPAPIVARVLGRMLANPQSAGSITGGNDPELRAHLDGSGLGAPSRMQTGAL